MLLVLLLLWLGPRFVRYAFALGSCLALLQLSSSLLAHALLIGTGDVHIESSFASCGRRDRGSTCSRRSHCARLLFGVQAGQ